MVVRGNTRITEVFIICQSLAMNSELALNGISLQHRMGNHLVMGLGGTIKCFTAHERLKRPFRNQILTAESMLEFCAEKIKNINFKFIGQTQLNEKRDEHKDRYDGIATLPGTRSFHQFVHIRLEIIKLVQKGAAQISTLHYSTI